jgi:hypothetical protein
VIKNLKCSQTCGDTPQPPSKKGAKFGELFCEKKGNFRQKFDAVLPFGDFSPKKR